MDTISSTEETSGDAWWSAPNTPEGWETPINNVIVNCSPPWTEDTEFWEDEVAREKAEADNEGSDSEDAPER